MPGSSLPIGYDLQIVDDDDVDDTTATTSHTATDTTAPAESVVSSSRYPRRQHRALSRFTDFVPLSYLTDGASP